MAQYGPTDLVITYGGTDMTAYVQSINGVKITDMMQDSQPFGAVWNAVSPTGTKSIDDIVLGGLYNDVANGPKAKWDTGKTAPTPNSATVNLVITVGGTNVITIPSYPSVFETKFQRNNITGYEATLKKGPGNVTVAP